MHLLVLTRPAIEQPIEERGPRARAPFRSF